ncbi:peroxisomal and mitochondrial division factor 1-like [Nicotiana sylvestris]|uniref:peroxisomal and mitochondrial division factor 1-like n=1 Tax=Nicotiana sylvestris TaxID=4096 RepID=UPI00388CA88D
MNEVDAPYLFNEAQQALNRAPVLHNETFLRYQDEMSQLEAEVKELVEKRDIYKLLSEQCEGEVKSLRAELDTAQKEHADLVEQELRTAKSVAEITRANAEEMVAQYKSNVEAAQDRLKDIVEYVKWQSRREALEEVYARGFDLSAKIKNARKLEDEAKKFAYPEDEEDSEGSGGSVGREDPDGPDDEAGYGEEHVA